MEREKNEGLVLDFRRVVDLHVVHLVDDLVDLLVEVVHELRRVVGGDGALARGLDEVLLLEDAQRVANLVMRVTRLVGHLDDPDGFVLDDHLQDLQMPLQHVDFLLKSVYHGIC